MQFSSTYNPTFFFSTNSYRVSHDITFVFILTTWTSRMLLMRLDCNSLLSVVSQFDWCRLSSAWQSQWPVDHRAETSFNRVTFTKLHNYIVYFSGKRWSLLHPNTVQGSFFPLQSYSKKTLRKNVPKSARKYKRNVLMPPGHPIILLKSN